ncbi:ATP-binding protein [Candidatus Poribacteria bacterium]
MAEESDFTLTIGLNVLNHLGKNLYSSIPAVISEVVANSYDADAEEVEITIDTDGGIITVIDNGCGMTRAECNNRYLTVGYSKRKEQGSTTPKYGRRVMGRKGIGKLSLFSIAKIIEVHTAKKSDDGGVQKSGFTMDIDDIQKWIESGGSNNCVLPPVNAEDIRINKGTKIILRNLRKDLSGTEAFLRRRLARRFSIIGEEYSFSVVLNGKPITIEDREFFKKLQYLWYFGDYGKKCMDLCTVLEHSEKLDGVVDAEENYEINGWIGTVNEQKTVQEGNNAIIIHSWGKSIHEDVLKDMGEAGIYSKYIIGEIRADFLDSDSGEDIATSGRQSVKEDDPRFLALKKHIRGILKTIQSSWTALRTEDAEEKALENEKVKEWFDELKGDTKKYARKLFKEIESFPIPDPEYKRQIYKHGILAFQNLALNDTLSTLEDIQSDAQFDILIKTLASMDQLEAMHYYEIIKGRMSVLKKFVDILPESKEKVIQKYIFDHLWLLDPSWERADTTTALVEQAVSKAFGKIDAGLNEEEKRARIDIRYRTAAGKHIIIELKKYDAGTNVFALAAQVNKYYAALMKCLKEKLPGDDHHVEAVCILGSPPTGASMEIISQTLQAVKARYITYDHLIKNTQDGYDEYLKKHEEFNRIQELINSI